MAATEICGRLMNRPPTNSSALAMSAPGHFHRDAAGSKSRHVGCTPESGSKIRALFTSTAPERISHQKENRTGALCFSPYLYRARNLVERFFNKTKHCRRVATRDDKLAANYLAFIQLASIRLWFRANDPTS
jgi:transposase